MMRKKILFQNSRYKDECPWQPDGDTERRPVWLNLHAKVPPGKPGFFPLKNQSAAGSVTLSDQVSR
jgi:hypothetical protein